MFPCMKRLAVMAGYFHALAWTAIAAPTDLEAAFQTGIRPLFEKYCYSCHGEQKAKAGLRLSSFQTLASARKDPKTWVTVLTQLRDRNMPPDGKPQPSIEERDRLVGWVEQTLDAMDDVLGRNPGRVLIHRLSRTEYNNTIRDLLGVDTRPADQFPADGGGGGGFDNNADTLFVPPILMEKYLEAAGEVLHHAAPERLFLVRPGLFTSKRAVARRNLDSFAGRAFRRPVERAEIDALLAAFDKAIQRGRTYEDSLKLAAKAVLVSPNFLFRVEVDHSTKEAYPISDYELASRLSYFLWSSMPDQALFKLAEGKRLRQPGVLEEQVHRMLADSKARTLADNFAGQWLRVRDLKTSAVPDPNQFPSFTPVLRDGLYAEPIEFFYSLLRENRPLLDLLDADYAFLNAELAKHYGIEGVDGPELRKVKLLDRNRGGVLGMGGVLTLTSYPLRTSPVLRGKWVLEEILGTPPPPPPPLVPTLSQDDKPREGLTFRQRLEQHRQKPECAACHKRMDPLGFGLENFDAIGRWRTQIAGQPVDASGVLPTGEKFTGPAELKKLLLNRQADFVRNLAGKVLSYALGRGLEYYDRPAVKKIVQALKQDDYRSATLIVEVVKSYPFQYRRSGPADAGQSGLTSASP